MHPQSHPHLRCRASRHGSPARLTAPGFVVLAAVALAALPSCGGTVGEAAADLLLPPQQEAELGRQLQAEVASQYRFHPNQEVQAYVAELGQRVVAASGPVHEAIQIEFTVIDDDEQVNAFAIPGGGIYVFSGLLLAAEDEAEVVGVLGHEVAHVTERHVAERLATAYGLELLASVALGDNPGTVAQLLASLAGTGVILRFSREQEREADAVGVGAMVRAGYDPYGMVRFFERLQGGGPRVFAFLQSHPAPEERIENIRRLIREHGSVPEERNEQGYTAFKDSLL
jgi:beta-barrel assembly-enhancing protease